MNRRQRIGRRKWVVTGALAGALALGCQSAPTYPVSPSTTGPVVRTISPEPLPSGSTLRITAESRPNPITPVVYNAPAEPTPLPTAQPGPPAGPPSDTIRNGHSPDYSSLIGELQYSYVQKAWRLRYAPLSEEDRYGGSVTLALADDPVGPLKPGQTIRVDGKLLNPDSRRPGPAYCVERLQPLR